MLAFALNLGLGAYVLLSLIRERWVSAASVTQGRQSEVAPPNEPVTSKDENIFRVLSDLALLSKALGGFQATYSRDRRVSSEPGEEGFVSQKMLFLRLNDASEELAARRLAILRT
jgi:hypothetical protein